MSTPDPTSCPRCGATIPPDAPRGLCPRCVLAGAATRTHASDPDDPSTAVGDIPSLERVSAAFPQFEIQEFLGRGSMGFVYRARQPHLDRWVALKLLPERLAREPRFTERFNREGRVLARLNHPNIVSVYDFGRTDEFYYLILEYVDGVNLRQAMQAGRFSPSEALAIVPRICEALQYAHEQGVLHRDIKPENILVDSCGRVKIADFGIAKLVGEDVESVTLTGTGTALGTPHYMAPEQLERPTEVDHRADIYSLGVVLYEMLTGELPLGRFAPPSERTPVHASVDAVVFRALERDREKRFQSAGQVKTEIEQVPTGAPGNIPELRAQAWASTPQHTWSWLGRVLPRLRRGELRLRSDRLTFLSGEDGRSVALRHIAGAALLPAPVISGRRRAKRLALLVDESGRRQLLEFDFRPGWFRTRRVAEQMAADWLAAVNHAVERCTGKAPSQEPVELEFAAIYPDGGTRRLWSFLELLFYASALGLLGMGRPETLLLGLMLIGGLILGARLFVAARRRTLALRPWREQEVARKAPERHSRAALMGAALVGLSLITPLSAGATMMRGLGAIGSAEMLLAVASMALPGLTGTLLGWRALREIRDANGAVRGLPLGVFAALTWPLIGLLGMALGPALFGGAPAAGTGWMTNVSQVLFWILPAVVFSFSLWAVRATTRWAYGLSLRGRLGVSKWVFAGALAISLGMVLRDRQAQVEAELREATDASAGALRDSQPVRSANLTVTAVRLRDGEQGSWLDLEYTVVPRDGCRLSFTSRGGIQGAGTVMTGSTYQHDRPGGEPLVVERLEFRLPPDIAPAEAEALRARTEDLWLNRPLRVHPGAEYTLIDLALPERGRVRVTMTCGENTDTP